MGTEREKSRKRCYSPNATEVSISFIVVLVFIGLILFKRPEGRNSTLELVQTDQRLEAVAKPGSISSQASPLDFYDKNYYEECQYWVETTSKWSKYLAEHQISSKDAVMAVQIRSGLGDRMSGLIAVFNEAIEKRLPFRIRWRHFGEAFELSEWIVPDKKTYYARIINSGKELKSNACLKESYYKCSSHLHDSDKCPVYARACVSPDQCNGILNHVSKQNMSMKHVIGCPLRTMLKPANGVLSLKLDYFLNSQISTSSLEHLTRKLHQEFRIISVHLRMGDFAFRHGLSETALKPIKTAVISCLADVERDMMYKKPKDARPIRWYIASDDYTLKQFFMTEYPEKTVILTAKAHHIGFVNRLSEEERLLETRRLFAEWMLIGQGEELVANEAHTFGVSSFSRLSWLYNLKDEYYSLDTKNHASIGYCFRKKFEYVGNLGEVSENCRP